MAQPPERRRELRVVFSPDRDAIGRIFEVGDGVVVGREGSKDGHIDDKLLSREHARITGRGPTLHIEDLDSSNGTYVNGKRVRNMTLQGNDVVSVGETLLVLDLEPPFDALPASEYASDDVEEIVGSSLVAQRLRRAVTTIAKADGHVLLRGATGTGKDVAARALHRLRAPPGPYVPVNCGAIAPGLAPSVLFGHVRGAFTGADADRDGHFVHAEGGTLFLDEFGDLPAEAQTMLLRVVEDGVIQPLGSSELRHVNVRIIAATLRSIEDGDFRRDLYARLEKWVLHVPSLAERRVDILELIERFGPMPMTAEAAEALLLWDWPNNVRELIGLVERQVVLLEGRTLVLSDLAPAMRLPVETRDTELVASGEFVLTPPSVDGEPSAEELDLILRFFKGNVAATAAHYEWHRNQVNRWIKRYKLDRHSYR